MWERALVILVGLKWITISYGVSTDRTTKTVMEIANTELSTPRYAYASENAEDYEVTYPNIYSINATHNNFKIEDNGEIGNIHVEAIYHSERNKIILHISWNTSIGVDDLDSYIFKVTPQSSFPECDDLAHETMKKDVTITSAYLPMPHHAYEVKPGCTYKINIIAEFVHHGKISKDILYSVPECVGKKCSCRNLKPIITNFRAEEVKPSELKISWNMKLQTNTKINNIDLPIFEYRPVVYAQHHNNPFRRISTNIDYSNETYCIVSADASTVLHPGIQYQLRTLFNNSYNCKTYEYTNFTVSSSITLSTSDDMNSQETKTNYLLHILLFVTVLLCIILAIAYLLRRNRLIIKEILYNPFSCRLSRHSSHPNVGSSYIVIPSGTKKQQEVNLLYVDKEIIEGCVDHYELPRSRVILMREIGEGAFGQVFLAKAFGIEKKLGYTYVAVKTLRERATAEEMDDFLSEIEMLKKVGEHPNIVRLFGCCILKEPYLMVMEFVPCGDLKHYLLNLREKWQKRRTKSDSTDSSTGSYIMPNIPSTARSRTLSDDRPSVTETEYTTLESEGFPTPTEVFNNKVESSLDHTELQNFALQIARGMEHLEKIPIAHRDLAARNILINEFKTLKISDFGLSRIGPYVNSKTKKMPLRWVAIEAIEDHFYDSKSDVWSFAVVLWEIGTLGAFPYDNVLDAMLPYYLTTGRRLPRPEICTDEVYNLMLKCWSHNPDERPSFQELVEILDTKRRRIYVDFNQLNPLYVFPPSTIEHIKQTNKSKDLK